MLAVNMNTLEKTPHEEENPKIKLLEKRIESLERALEKYLEHPSDLAANWRRRLAAVHSNYVVLTMDKDKKPKAGGGLYKVIRVLESDPENFLVLRKGEKVGKMFHRDHIEKLISEYEGKTK